MNTLLRLTRRTAPNARSTPVNYIPLEERRKLIETATVHLWRIARHLKIDLGRFPTAIMHEDGAFHTADVLEDLSRLNIDLCHLHHALGTADVALAAFDEVNDSIAMPSVTPNMQAILDLDADKLPEGTGTQD